MSTTFVGASDAEIINLVVRAKRRLVVIAPAHSSKVARAIAERMDDLPELSLSVILDPDPEVYRMGYGEVDALEIIRDAAARSSFRLQEQEGIRICAIVSDDSTMIYSPVSRNIEAGSTSNEKPNGLYLSDGVADELAKKAGMPVHAEGESQPEIGRETLSSERVKQAQEDLKQNPPLPVDLTRKLNVFITRVQYVELKAKGYQPSRRRAELPKEFVGMANDELKERVTGRIRTPLDAIDKLDVEIEVGGEKEKLKVDEKFLQNERNEIEKALTHVMPGRGRIILRKDRESFDHQIERFESIVGAYQNALVLELEKEREKFRKSFVDEFLHRWKAEPPSPYNRHLEPPTDDQLKRDIEGHADRLFDRIVNADSPEVSVIYKEIAIEDLENAEFMDALRDIMAKGGVSGSEIERLFEKGEAAAGQDSFNASRGTA